MTVRIETGFRLEKGQITRNGEEEIFGGQCHSFWIFISYIGMGTIWRLMRRRLIHTLFRLGFACGFVD